MERKELPKPSVMVESILKEHSEEDFEKAVRHLMENSPKAFIRNTAKQIFDSVPYNSPFIESHVLSHGSVSISFFLTYVCKFLGVKIPYREIKFSKYEEEAMKRQRKERKLRDSFKPPYIDYEEEIKKIQGKYKMKIQQFCEGKTRFESCYTSFKRKEFYEIIDLYLARIAEPHKPDAVDDGRPPYVVWSLAEINHSMGNRRIPMDVIDKYDEFLNGFIKQHLDGESLDYRAIAREFFHYFIYKICDYELREYFR